MKFRGFFFFSIDKSQSVKSATEEDWKIGSSSADWNVGVTAQFCPEMPSIYKIRIAVGSFK